MTMTRQKLIHMVPLLDDKEVGAIVANRLLSIAIKDYGTIETYYLKADMSDSVSVMLEKILEKARCLQVSRQLGKMLASPELDWLEILNTVARLQYVNISSAPERHFIKGVVNAIELEITPAQLNKTKICHLRNVIHSMYNFKPCSDCNATEPGSLFFNDFLSMKKGHRILVSLLYFVVARQLNLPLVPYRLGSDIIFGVPVQKRIVAGKDANDITDNRTCKIDFFVMPSQNGKEISYNDIVKGIHENYLSVEDQFAVLNEHEVAKFYLEHLAGAYQKNKHFGVAEELYSLVATI